MARSEDDSRTRLQRSAVELFAERGYDRTTAAEIAARAGVTERTFFRHFPDKREVLFDGEAVLRNALKAAIAEAPGECGPLDMLFYAFRSTIPLLEGNRHFAKPRQDVISRTPALAEREAAKLAALSDSLAEALKSRGIEDLKAVLGARAGMAAFAHATITWLDDPALSLPKRLDLALAALKSLSSGDVR